MVLNVTEPVPQYRLDFDAARAPFPVTKPATATMLPRTAAKRPRDVRDAPPDIRFANHFEDHPNVSTLPLVNNNYLTRADNYLVRAQVHRYFFTAFVAKDTLNRRSSDYIPLAYITWRTIWDGLVVWKTRSREAAWAMHKKEYNADPVTTAYPPAKYASLIEKPTVNPTEMFSEINTTTFSNALSATANNRNCMASKDWPTDAATIMMPL